MDSNLPILAVEDNSEDEELTLRALTKNHIHNLVVVARDGVEALDYLFGRGSCSGRDLSVMPQLILLDLKHPKVVGFDVLRQLRADVRTRLLPSSMKRQHREGTYISGANSYVRKPADFAQFIEAVRQLGLHWLIPNAPPPGNL